jgi:hypothetical protein
MAPKGIRHGQIQVLSGVVWNVVGLVPVLPVRRAAAQETWPVWIQYFIELLRHSNYYLTMKNINLVQCIFTKIMLWNAANFICDMQVYINDLPLAVNSQSNHYRKSTCYNQTSLPKILVALYITQKVTSNAAIAELIKWFILKDLTLKFYKTNFMKFSTNDKRCITLHVGCDNNTAGKVVI